MMGFMDNFKKAFENEKMDAPAPAGLKNVSEKANEYMCLCVFWGALKSEAMNFCI